MKRSNRIATRGWETLGAFACMAFLACRNDAVPTALPKPPPDLAPAASGPGSVAGTVVDARGAPVRKFYLHVYEVGGRRGRDGREDLTNGIFDFSRINAGVYWFTAGVPEAKLHGQVKVTIAPGQAVRDLNIVIRPTATVSGAVLDETGRPLHGAEVQLGASGVSSTDRMGRYVLIEVPTGESELTIRYFGWPDVVYPVTVAAPTTALGTRVFRRQR